MRYPIDAPTDAPIVPDFTPVSAEQVRHHMDTCPDCHGPIEGWCPVGRDLFARFREQGEHESRKADRKQANDLIRAGWRFFPQGEDDEVMSWYWRSPPKRKGSDGRLYRSTNQAWMAMRRAAGLPIDGAR